MQTLRSYGPTDDPGITDGDTGFRGVNTYDSAENLQPGEVQEAVNVDFTSQDAVTRGGLVCLPELGNAPFDFEWTSRTSAADSSWSSICYGNGLFVAVNSSLVANGVMTSPDGFTWTARAAAGVSAWSGVCFGNGQFVAVANAAAGGVYAMTSEDGITWTARTLEALQWNCVAYGNGKYVALADPGSPTPTRQVATSTNGITWVVNNSAEANQWSDIIYGNSLFVATSFSGTHKIMTSPDGVTWTARTTPVGVALTGVAYGNGRYVAVSFSVSTLTSTDGVTWTEQTVAFSKRSGIAYGGGYFATVGTDSDSPYTSISPNGVNWTIIPSAASNNWSAITYGGGIFVSVSTTGTGNRVMTIPVINVFASGVYSDPDEVTNPWIVLVGATQAGFFSFGQTSRYVSYPAGYTVSQQSTVVQANNLLFIFSGPDQVPIQWNGDWNGAFIVCPASTLGVGYEDIPWSNQATYTQNRLWVPNGKDTLSASQALDFKNFNVLAGSFNLNYGASDYIVCSYPFGNNGLVVFKNRSSFLLQNIEGTLTDVTSTEITRQLGIIGINAVTAVGPDLVYMTSDRNITSIRLNIQNATQAVTVPISQKINPIMRRVNWTYGYKVSMGYWNNLLFVALPLDNATACNTIIVYNFITNSWYGEWNFADSIGVRIQGFVTANYLGQVRMHAITEDGRIFVVNEGQNDISGATVAEIETSLTTRAYVMNNENRFNRRMFADLSTNRPNFSIRAYVDGVNEYSDILTNQTYLRSQSWRFPAPSYQMDNSDDDFNQAFRKDYATGPDSIQSGSGFLPEATQDYRIPLIFRRGGRLVWYRVQNTTGLISVNSIGGEARPGLRNNLTEVGT